MTKATESVGRNYLDSLTIADEIARLDSGQVIDAAVWKRLVARAVKSTPLDRDPSRQEDLLQAGFERLLELRAKQSPQWTLLLGLAEPQAMKWLKTFFHNLAVDDDPLREPLKALTNHVIIALAERDMRELSPPPTLREGGRFSAARVREAVAWFVRESPRKGLPASAVARSLLRIYEADAGFEPAPEEAHAWPELLVRRRSDGAWKARAILSRLTFSEALALSWHLQQKSLDQLAQRLGISRTTAHKTTARALAVVERAFGPVQHELEKGPSRGTALSAFYHITFASADELRSAAGRVDVARPEANASEADSASFLPVVE